jgi:hypothetical protein
MMAMGVIVPMARQCAEILPGAVFRPALAQDQRRRVQEQAGHDRRDRKVGPGRACAPDADRRQHDHDIADRVVARAEPDRADIGVAILVARQQQHAGEIGGERKEADHAHHLGARQARPEKLVAGRAQHP